MDRKKTSENNNNNRKYTEKRETNVRHF